MRRTMMKGKIHRATVTGASADYEGSVTIPRELMEAADILQHEQVHLLDVTNGRRLVTYAIAGKPGELCVNGAAARLVDVGDIVIIISYASFSAAKLAGFEPLRVYVDDGNRISLIEGGGGALPDGIASKAENHEEG